MWGPYICHWCPDRSICSHQSFGAPIPTRNQSIYTGECVLISKITGRYTTEQPKRVTSRGQLRSYSRHCYHLCICCIQSDIPHSCWLSSLAHGQFEWSFSYLIFQIISVIDGWVISSELALRWMSLDFTDDKSTLVQVTAWCRQATSHYLSQCWPRYLSPYGVTMPQWVTQLM